MTANHIAQWERELEIKGVLFGRNRTVTYNSDLLVEVYRDPLSSLYDELNHLYWIVTSMGVERKWGVHKKTQDTYSAVYGSLEVALWDGREGSCTNGVTLVTQLNAQTGDALRIPAGIWHTFRSKTETAVLLNSKNPSWNEGNPDKLTYDLSESNPPFVWQEI